MASATIDHMVSMIIFLAAILLFMNLFSQTNETAIIYESHRAIASKCSDLLDNILLNPGSPSNWGQTNQTPSAFGIQNPEFTQYKLSPFSIMRLAPTFADSYLYDKTIPETLYYCLDSDIENLMFPVDQSINYSLTQRLLGINGTHGFQLSLTPLVDVLVDEVNAANPLRLALSVSGTGFPLVGAVVEYCFIDITLGTEEGEYPHYEIRNGTAVVDEEGEATIEFPEITEVNRCYGFIAYAHLGGLSGIGYYKRVTSSEEFIVPLIEKLNDQKVLITHNYDLNSSGPAGANLKYNVTFVMQTEDFSLREMYLDQPDKVGTIISGVGNPYGNITIPTYTSGVLIVTYQKNAIEGGIVMMPWGISSLAFPMVFGDDPENQEWVATDMRQVTIDQISYQATLSLWGYEHIQVNN